MAVPPTAIDVGPPGKGLLVAASNLELRALKAPLPERPQVSIIGHEGLDEL
jgi:hypothetical protein